MSDEDQKSSKKSAKITEKSQEEKLANLKESDESAENIDPESAAYETHLMELEEEGDYFLPIEQKQTGLGNVLGWKISATILGLALVGLLYFGFNATRNITGGNSGELTPEEFQATQIPAVIDEEIVPEGGDESLENESAEATSEEDQQLPEDNEEEVEGEGELPISTTDDLPSEDEESAESTADEPPVEEDDTSDDELNE